jgi:hypothetical protein
MTMVVRDEADIVEANLAFHLNAGVDFVVALDNGSRDGTAEILESYAAAGRLRLLRDSRKDIRRGGSQTALARLAATELGADWVITTDADQFYWPRGGTLKEVLEAVPERFGVVSAPRRVFVPRPGTQTFFADRMTVRLAAGRPINDPASPFRPQSNVVHRAHPGVVVSPGNHGVTGVPHAPLRGWHPIEVLHFPLRSAEQCERKYVAANPDWLRNVVRTKAVAAHADGRFREYYDSLVVDDAQLERGLADGTLAVDTRLRDALSGVRDADGALSVSNGVPAFRFEPPSLAEQAGFALELAVLHEADLVREQRRLDALEHRVAALERGLGRVLAGRIRRLAARPGRRG